MSDPGEHQDPMALKPIGTVRNDVKDPGMHDSREIVSEIVCDPGFNDALDGIEEFSHIMVIFWMHRSPAWEHSQSKTHPQRREDLPLVGVLATHSPFRPNRLGVTVVRLLERRDNVLKVVGLDAIDGTPVVDIKPHLPDDLTTELRVPDWVHQLRRSGPRRQT